MIKLGAGFTETFPGRHIGYIVNKSDLIAEPEAIPLPPELTRPGTSLIRTSAKTGTHVEHAFIDAADSIARRSR